MFTIIKPNTHFDFMGKRYIFMGISLLLMSASVYLLATKGLNYGIDFTGGIELRVRAGKDISISDIRQTLKQAKLSDISVQNFGKDGEYLVKVSSHEKHLNTVVSRIEQVFNSKYGTKINILKVDVVGPKVGRELRLGGLYSILYALLGILIYIAFRFNYQFSPGAVIALIHDVLITLGVFSLLQRQFTLSTIAALLTIIGYSLNDTIVVYDRIREVMGNLKGTVLDRVINKAINETLSRTLLTSLTTLIVVVALMFYGGDVIGDFALALLVGVIVGTYSSIFIASPIIIMFKKHKA